MRKDEICVHGISGRVEIVVYERNFLLLFWGDEFLLVFLELLSILSVSPSGCPIFDVVSRLL